MPLSLPAMNAAIVCDGKELEAYDVKQEGTSSLTAFIANEAGKGGSVSPLHYEPLLNQLFCGPGIQDHVLKYFNRL
jgi:hypothetical protein